MSKRVRNIYYGLLNHMAYKRDDGYVLIVTDSFVYSNDEWDYINERKYSLLS